MAKKPPNQGLRHNLHAGREGEVADHLEERHFRYVDQMERWRQEYERYQLAEEKLLVVSKLSYDPVDYAPLLVRLPWKERPIPDFSFLLDEAKVTTENKFFMPVTLRLVGLIFSLSVLIFSSTTAFLWVAGIMVATMLGLLFITVQERQKAVELALLEAKAEIERREEQERKSIEEARKQHEKTEDERIDGIEKLLAGEIPAIVLRLDSVLPKLGLPVPIDVNIDIYENIPLIKVWLPSKSIIPNQICSLLPSGRVKYTDKEPRSINKQYIELCAAIIMQIMSAIYANVPSFERAYVRGFLKSVPDNDCLIDIQLDRESLIKACHADTGLVAVQQVNGRFEIDTMLNLKPMDVKRPAEWGDVPAQMLRSMHFKVFR